MSEPEDMFWGDRTYVAEDLEVVRCGLAIDDTPGPTHASAVDDDAQGAEPAGVIERGLDLLGIGDVRVHEHSAIEIRSPAVSSMSNSRGYAPSVTWPARSISSSVDFPIAETTTTTSLPFVPKKAASI